MCGIAGLICADHREVSEARLKRMTDIIAHRGPDGEGQWVSENGKVGLGHRRLSIIDLSEHAAQPMHYLERYTIAFNGEIYNYVELKETLLKQGYTFRTTSDTEVLMALYHRDKEQCLQLLDGMFAFAIYDKEEQTVFCARDRFGEKPFFYSYEPGRHFIFGSEMKALWEAGVNRVVNKRMLFNYLYAGYWDNPHDISETFFKSCVRLPHSHYIKVNVPEVRAQTVRYYDIDWRRTDDHISVEKASERLKEIFYTSVSRRLRSDVAVGSSLSGGLDSSLVVAVINELKKGSSQVQRTFSAVFPGFKKDESRFIHTMVNNTNVEPFYITPTDEGMIEDLEKLIYHQEEPFGSASIYVQYCVMKLAKENNVTVLLDGQGADEILAGYHPFYQFYFKELRKSNPKLYASELQAYDALHVDNTINEKYNRSGGIKDIVREYAPFAVNTLKKVYNLVRAENNAYLSKDFLNSHKKELFLPKRDINTLSQSLYDNTMNGGLQVLLNYADRNSMAHSREVRLPFLSVDLVDFLFSLPSNFKIRRGWTKWIMRETFQTELPPEIGWRKDKIGFEPPQKSWMGRPEIRDRIRVAREKLVREGILDKKIRDNDILPAESNSRGDNSWAQLMAGEIL